MTRKFALAVAPLLAFTLFAFLLIASSWVKGASASQPSVADETSVRQTLFFSEGFESGVFAPTGWDVITHNQKVTSTWQALSGALYAHTGQWGAGVLSDTEAQDEKLLTPPIVVPDGGADLVFWAKVPDVSDFSNFGDNVELWLVVDEPDFGEAPDDDINLTYYLVKGGLEEDGVWTEIRYNLAPYQGSTVRVAWRYTAEDAGDFFLDDVRIEREESRFDPPHNHLVAPYKI